MPERRFSRRSAGQPPEIERGLESEKQGRRSRKDKALEKQQEALEVQRQLVELSKAEEKARSKSSVRYEPDRDRLGLRGRTTSISRAEAMDREARRRSEIRSIPSFTSAAERLVTTTKTSARRGRDKSNSVSPSGRPRAKRERKDELSEPILRESQLRGRDDPFELEPEPPDYSQSFDRVIDTGEDPYHLLPKPLDPERVSSLALSKTQATPPRDVGDSQESLVSDERWSSTPVTDSEDREDSRIRLRLRKAKVELSPIEKEELVNSLEDLRLETSGDEHPETADKSLQASVSSSVDRAEQSYKRHRDLATEAAEATLSSLQTPTGIRSQGASPASSSRTVSVHGDEPPWIDINHQFTGSEDDEETRETDRKFRKKVFENIGALEHHGVLKHGTLSPEFLALEENRKTLRETRKRLGLPDVVGEPSSKSPGKVSKGRLNIKDSMSSENTETSHQPEEPIPPETKKFPSPQSPCSELVGLGQRFTQSGDSLGEGSMLSFTSEEILQALGPTLTDEETFMRPEARYNLRKTDKKVSFDVRRKSSKVSPAGNVGESPGLRRAVSDVSGEVNRERERIETVSLQELKALEETAKSKLKEAKDRLNNQHQELLHQLRDEHESEVKSLRETYDAVKSEHVKRVEKLQEQIDLENEDHKQAYRDLQKRVKQETKEIKERSDAEILQIKNEVLIEKKRLEKALKKELEQFEASEGERLRLSKEQHKILLEGNLQTYTELLKGKQKKAMEKLEKEYREQTDSAEEEAKQKLQKAHKHSLGELQDIHEGELASIKSRLEEIRKENMAEVERQEVEITKVQSENLDKIKELKEQFEAEIESIRSDSDHQRKRLLETHENDIGLLKADLINDYEEKKDQLEEEYTEKHKELERKHAQAHDEVVDKNEESLQKFKTDLAIVYQEKRDLIESEARAALEKFEKDVNKTRRKQASELEKELEELGELEERKREEFLATKEAKLRKLESEWEEDFLKRETAIQQKYNKKRKTVEDAAIEAYKLHQIRSDKTLEDKITNLEKSARKKLQDARDTYEHYKRTASGIKERSKELSAENERAAERFDEEAKIMRTEYKKKRDVLKDELEAQHLAYLEKLTQKQAESEKQAYEHALAQQKGQVKQQLRKIEEQNETLEQSLRHLWPIRPGEKEPTKPTQTYYTFCLANRGVSVECEDYVRKVDYWLDRRRHLALPAVINVDAEYRFDYWTDRSSPLRVNKVRPPTPDIDADEIRDYARDLEARYKKRREGDGQGEDSDEESDNEELTPKIDLRSKTRPYEEILGASSSGTAISMVTPTCRTRSPLLEEEQRDSFGRRHLLARLSTRLLDESEDLPTPSRGRVPTNSPRKEGGGAETVSDFRTSQENLMTKEAPILGGGISSSTATYFRETPVSGSQGPFLTSTGRNIPGDSKETLSFKIKTEGPAEQDLEGPNPVRRVSSIMMDEITREIRNMMTQVSQEQKVDNKRALERTVEEIVERVKGDSNTSKDLEDVMKEMQEKTERRPQHLPEFDPKTNEVDDFIVHFEDIMTHRNEPVHKRISQLKICCRSSARQYVDEILSAEGYTHPAPGSKLKEEFDYDWYKDKVLEGLRKRYSSRSDLTAEVTVEALTKKGEETLIQYYDRVVQTCKHAGKIGSQITCAFVKGLPREYKVFIMQRAPGILKGLPDEAVELARQYEGIHEYDVMDTRAPVSAIGAGGGLVTTPDAKTTDATDNTSRQSIAKMGDVMLRMAKRLDDTERSQRQLRESLQSAQKQLRDKRQPDRYNNGGVSAGSDSPDWRNRQNRPNYGRMSTNQPVFCHYCSGPGHVMAECRLYADARQQQYANPSGRYQAAAPRYPQNGNGTRNPWNRGRGGGNSWNNYGGGRQPALPAPQRPTPALPAPEPQPSSSQPNPARGNKYQSTGPAVSLN